MQFKLRAYESEEDYWRLRAFLRRVYIANGHHEYSWQTSRLDYWWWFGNPELEHYRFEDVIWLWEDDAGEIVAFLTPESHAMAYLNVDPARRSAELEMAMLETAELRLAERDETGKCKVTAWAHADDRMRQDILQARGYVKGDWPEYQRRRSLDGPLPEAKPLDGYVMRSLGDVDELPARAWVSWRAFHPDGPEEDYIGWKWYPSIQRCPLYRRDLDLVVAAADGSLAAFCTVWFDDVTRTGYFEPVGVAPECQGRGLGKAIMCEGLRRLKQLGGAYATVTGFSDAANALYASVMSREYLLMERWEKSF
ncbi:MAG: GNAT family N-acetyltransferase [Anaerolineae bacterium]|nr:GNAT family N-acetyltransferase [Anaerolineae bacterium]